MIPESVIRYSKFQNMTCPELMDQITVGGINGLNAPCFDGGGFDGRYVYFVPLQDGVVVGCDVRSDFQDGASWQAFDAKQIGMGMCVGVVFDGQYLYFVPYMNPVVVRYDTTGDFTNPDSWTSYDADHTGELPSVRHTGAIQRSGQLAGI